MAWDTWNTSSFSLAQPRIGPLKKESENDISPIPRVKKSRMDLFTILSITAFSATFGNTRDTTDLLAGIPGKQVEKLLRTDLLAP
uniref:Uncharacterized protein n=1 Tax=Candidatus Kentrum sp. SD TaxID=2126332 RepID=A0A450Z5H7_9GAMM|nr:MAG: hypothetical protein BECKSD772F_GA0070984_11503 [Candidatus Kentron sp. SD]VFK49036.1 MAG: hypothetical protein BECKSD772E_GA0070983_11553 [Candidatus Kentron sp. SD]VFK78701.1 MAG: hypothetical protein BECKSD772D_GA0070982_102222 [Candidatus Kentron sp. SD]